MAENRNKKKRVARIGNMTSAQGAANLHCDDGLAQADCNLVYNIMQSMDKSQNAMSYQQLQEQSKERTINSEKNSSNKRNSKSRSSKQLKKLIPEKTFPLMAKCQKSMKYLKKNMCIPKPRAHVGSLPRPPQIPKSNFKSKYINSNCRVSSDTITRKKRSMEIKQHSENRECSEINAKRKKAKISHSSDSSPDKNTSQTESIEKEPKLSSGTDSDNEFEQFLQKHHPEKCKASHNYSTDSPVARRKMKIYNKIKRKERNKHLVYAKKISKVTSKKLSDFEESAESEIECNENNPKNIIDEDDLTENSYSGQFPVKRFQRIIEYKNSDDSASDTHLNDSGILNYVSSSSSEDENMEIKSSNKGNVNNDMDLDDSERLDNLPTEPNSAALASTSLSGLKNTQSCYIEKLKCNTPCFVLIKRDPWLDQKAASLQTGNSSVTNMVPVANLYDDCIIMSETSTNDFITQESENVRQSNRNPCQGKSTDISKSPVSSEGSAEINGAQNKYMLNEKLIYGSNSLRPQTETNSLVSNQKLAEILCDDKSMEVQMDEKEVSRSVAASRKSLSDTEKDECFIVNKVIRHSDKNVNSDEYKEKGVSSVNSISWHSSDLSKDETGNTLIYDRATSSTEKEIFNVQILSVKSLNESDIIIVSDDDEGKDSETIPNINVTKKSAVEDSDVEIICLDSSIVDKKKCVNKNVKGVLNNETHNKVDKGLKENSNSSLAQPIALDDEDCIILDDVDLPSEKCTAKNADKMQQSSQVNMMSDSDGIINGEKTHSNKNGETISGKELDSANSIFKILETIDFNCIKKVLNETVTTDTQKVNSDSDAAKPENSLCDDIQTLHKEKTSDSFPEKLKPSQNDTRLTQKETSVDVNITPVGYSEVNINIRNLKTTLVDSRDELSKLAQNSNVSHKTIKNGSENKQDSMKSNNISSSSNCDKGSTVFSSSTNFTAPKLSVCEKEIIASNHKAEPNVLFHSRKNQQLPPTYPKMKSYESHSNELDIIAAKSIQNLDEHEKKTILPLLELYRAEYQRFLEIKCTEENVTAGLKLLQERQTKKLMVISSSIKNLVKNDGCFHKVNNEFRSNRKEQKKIIKSSPVKKDESLNEIKKSLEYVAQPSNSNSSGTEKDDTFKIFHPSVVERASEVLNSKSVGPSSSQQVYNHLINSVCAECGKHAVAACLGCAKIYYCSEKCGISYWSKGHYATCRR